MKLNASEIKKILVISLSNVGDCILTFPVIDILKRDFPQAGLCVVAGPKAQSIFKGNPYITKVYAFDKRQPLKDKIRWVWNLRKERFDLIVDLRNTAIPFLIGAKYKTPLSAGGAKMIHMKQKHLNRLKTVFDFSLESQERFALCADSQDSAYAAALLTSRVKRNESFVVVAPGAANNLKRWKEDGFAEVCGYLIKNYKKKIVFVGDNFDSDVVSRVISAMNDKSQYDVINACGQTTLTQLAGLLARSSLVIANDSGVMHMASYLGVPTVAVFGPTDPVKYGPWNVKSRIVKSTAFCTACHKPNCQYAHECMDYIQPEEVLAAVRSCLQL